jgi:alpha-mannosidase
LLGGDNLVVSALKKSDLSSRVLLRVFEIEGSAAEVPVEFLGQQRSFREVNLLEEELPAAGTRSLKVNPYEIRTITLDMGGVPAP